MTNPGSNPYVGPRAFEPDETLYGRGRELRLLAAQLISERVVLLHSPSGAGKTSLIQAGLIPLLREENFHILPVARVNLEPDPLAARAQGFNRYVYSVIAVLEEGLPLEQRRPLPSLAGQTLDAYLSERPRPAGAPRSDMLIFDQFEEFLTTAPTDREGKQAFFVQLGAALRNTSRWALFSMREDYIGAAAPYVRPLPNRFEITFRLDLLGEDAALQAIQSPARAAGVEFSDVAAHRLVDDLRRVQVQAPDGSLESVLGEYIEPVQLQVVCYRLWESLAEDAGRIDLDNLAAVGDVDKSLGDYYAACARSAAERAGLDERALREWFNAKLITKEGIRGQVLMGAQSSEGLDNAAVRLLEDAHIIRGEKRAGATWFELSHDRLIQPVRQNNVAWFAQNLSLFQRQAGLWAQQGRPDGLLLRGKALAQAEKEAGALSQTADESAFLAACRKLHAQERLRRGLMTSVAVLFVLSVVFLVLSYLAYNLATARSVITSGRIALADSNPRYAALLALQARQVADIPEAQELLEDATDAVDFSGGRGLLGHLDRVNSVAWSADGRLASGSYDGTVIIWDLESGRPAQTLRGHTDWVSSVAWSTDGRLASVSVDGMVILWDLESGTPAQVLRGYSDVTSVAWSPDGRLASGSVDGTVTLWDLESGTPAQTLKWDSGVIYSLAWSMDGQLASGSNNALITIWDLESSEPAKVLKGHLFPVTSLAWSSDGRLTSGSPDGTAILWDLENGKPAQEMGWLLTRRVSSVAWSADGWLTSGSADGTVILWDLQSGKPAQVLQGHSDFVASVAWSQDGRLASGSADGTVILWDLESTEPAQVLQRYSDSVESAAWSQDGRLASGSERGTVILWDLESGTPAQVLQGHSGSVDSVAWSEDGRLASGAWDDKVILWDLESGTSAKVLQAHSGSVTSVAWSANGRLASVSVAGTLSIYQRKFLGHHCEWVLRNMTVAEWVDVLGMSYAYRPACYDLPGDMVEFPQLADWQAWMADLGKDLSVFTNSRYLPPRFLLLTWPGRGLLVAATLLVIVAGYALILRIQKGTIGWAAAALAAGLILLAGGLKWENSLVILSGWVTFSLGVSGLAARFSSRGEVWWKTGLALAFLIGNLLWLADYLNGIELLQIPEAFPLIPVMYVFWAVPLLALLLWLAYQGDRWLLRKRRTR